MEGDTFKRLDIKGIDDLIRHLGNPGRFQTLTFVLLGLNYFPVVFHHVSMAFYGYTPSHYCHPDNLPVHGISTLKPPAPGMSYSVNGANVTDADNGDVIFRTCDVLVTKKTGENYSQWCDPGQIRYQLPESEITVVMEWDLVCERAYYNHLATTVYYCGVMLGGFSCGYLSDLWGRRPVMLATVLGGTGLGTGLAFVRQFPVFLVLRFVLGFLTQGLHTSTFIMAIELFPMKHRTRAGCLIQLFWGAAVLALGGVAWILKDWRKIQLAISLPSLLAISYYWLVPESLRWMLAKSKNTKAEGLIRRIAAFNRLDTPFRRHPEMATRALLQPPNDKVDDVSNHNSRSSVNIQALAASSRKEKGQKNKQASIKDLFSSTIMLKRSMILFYVWFAGNVSYFGLTFMSTSLAGSRYLNYSLSAGVEFLAYVLNLFILTRFGRRNPLCLYFCVASLSCLGIGLVPSTTASGQSLSAVTTAFSVMGKFASGGSFTLFELLTVEMYPTVLRNVGLGLCGFWGRLGAMLAPMCLGLGIYTFSQLPAILIGALTLVGAGLTLLLPDTSKAHLPDTVHEITVDIEVTQSIASKMDGFHNCQQTSHLLTASCDHKASDDSEDCDHMVSEVGEHRANEDCDYIASEVCDNIARNGCVHIASEDGGHIGHEDCDHRHGLTDISRECQHQTSPLITAHSDDQYAV